MMEAGYSQQTVAKQSTATRLRYPKYDQYHHILFMVSLPRISVCVCARARAISGCEVPWIAQICQECTCGICVQI